MPAENGFFSASKRARGPASAWRYPSFWAFAAGLLTQLGFGILATIVASFALLMADGGRCPVALGATSTRPLAAFTVAVFLGVLSCEWLSETPGWGTSYHSSTSWVLWGGIWVWFADL